MGCCFNFSANEENWTRNKTANSGLSKMSDRERQSEQWWNDTDRGKLKYWEKNIIQCGW
jgi:hypothetical protein